MKHPAVKQFIIHPDAWVDLELYYTESDYDLPDWVFKRKARVHSINQFFQITQAAVWCGLEPIEMFLTLEFVED